MRRTQPNRHDRSEPLRSLGIGYAALLAGLPFAAQLFACAGPSKIDVPEGSSDAGIGGSNGPGDTLRCGPGAIRCGGESRDPSTAGCCPAGNTCTAEGTCWPDESCTTKEECTADMACGGGTCRPWSLLAAATRGADQSCRNNVELPKLKPEVQCHWPLSDNPPADYPTSVQVLGTPMVMDFDFDKNPSTHHPSIVFISYSDPTIQSGVLRVIDGKDCTPQFSATGEFPFMQDISPALGDVDGDRRPDIVVADLVTNGTGTKAGVAVYKADAAGTSFKLLARQTGSPTQEFTRISLYDFDGLADGLPEIVTDTGIYAVKAGQGGSLSGIVLKQSLEGNNLLEPPIVRDINGDLTAELVTANGIFNWNEDQQKIVDRQERNAPLWNPYSGATGAGFVGMADLGKFTTATGADSVEMVIVNNTQLVVAKIDGGLLMNVKATGLVGGPPVIADFDGDGRMEFASPGRDQITAFDLDCYDDDKVNAEPRNCKNPDGPNPQGILWTRNNLHGASSGASLFDFDGDQRAEVVYADQCFLRILDGLTGNQLFSVPRSSTTRYDYPVVADVDGDTHTEIVTAENDAQDAQCPSTDPLDTSVSFRKTHGITVWHDANDKWAGSRQLWNQYTYSINNVNDDGTVPPMKEVVSQWNKPELNHNSLRQNVQGATGVSLQLADLTVSASPVVKCSTLGGRATLSANLCNRGLLDVPVDKVNIRMAPASSPGSSLCELANKTVLRSGKCEPVTCEVAVPTRSANFDVLVMADSTQAVAECTEGASNTALITNVYCSESIQ
ncbi:MAG: VCBS repeat-containing protein [Deltaproteobacteria bacterium]